MVEKSMLDSLVIRFQSLLPLSWRRQVNFTWYYRRKQTPWDTNQTPPEVIEFVAHHESMPKRAKRALVIIPIRFMTYMKKIG